MSPSHGSTPGSTAYPPSGSPKYKTKDLCGWPRPPCTPPSGLPSRYRKMSTTIGCPRTTSRCGLGGDLDVPDELSQAVRAESGLRVALFGGGSSQSCVECLPGGGQPVLVRWVCGASNAARGARLDAVRRTSSRNVRRGEGRRDEGCGGRVAWRPVGPARTAALRHSAAPGWRPGHRARGAGRPRPARTGRPVPPGSSVWRGSRSAGRAVRTSAAPTPGAGTAASGRAPCGRTR